MNHFDFVIIGSGIAGLYSAILARKHGSVLIITKGSIEDCNTRYAQGGIAAAIGKNDSPTLHFKDTIAAGDGLCDKEAAHILVNEAPERIAELVRLGVPFPDQIRRSMRDDPGLPRTRPGENQQRALGLHYRPPLFGVQMLKKVHSVCRSSGRGDQVTPL